MYTIPKKLQEMDMGLENEKLFSHFSHEHPLKRIANQSNSTPSRRNNITCSGCKHNIVPTTGSDYYSCTSCPFDLHELCYSVPRKTQHPSHTSHFLTLLSTNSSPECAFECKACGNKVSGLYYSCDECGIYYHILCSALPLSVSTHSHPHTLNLEFSPPYDFFCDLCNKPSYNGWLYRCNICEFDTHLECAVSSAKRVEIESDTDCNTKSNDQSTPTSEDITTPSYQFSDACFSIDLAKSFTDQVVGQEAQQHHDHETMIKVVPEVQETIGYAVADDHNRLSTKLLLGGGTQVWDELSQKREGNEFMGRSSSMKLDQTTKPETENSKCSSWWKFLSFC